MLCTHSTLYLPAVWPMLYTDFTHTHARTRARTHARMHAHTHTPLYLLAVWPMLCTHSARTHARTHAHTHTHTHTPLYLLAVWPMLCTHSARTHAHTHTHTVPTCSVAHALCVIRPSGGGGEGRAGDLPHQPTLLPGSLYHTPLCLQHPAHQGEELQEGLVQLATNLGRRRRRERIRICMYVCILYIYIYILYMKTLRPIYIKQGKTTNLNKSFFSENKKELLGNTRHTAC